MSNPRATGVIVPVEVEVRKLLTLLMRWGIDDLSTVDAAYLIRSTARHLDTACWCTMGCCCVPHGKHSDPHKNCILR
jgi:hypothetical protein